MSVVILIQYMTHVLIVLSSLYPCGSHAADPLPFSVEMLVLWFFSLSLWYLLQLHSHLWKTIMVVFHFGLQILWTASHTPCNLIAYLCFHYLGSPVIFLLLLCIPGCLCIFVLHLYLWLSLVFIHLCLYNGCVCIANLL